MSRFIQTVSPMKGGTKMTYGGVLYHFTPNELGDYVAEVADDQHYDAILSIGAGYQPYPAKDAQAAAEAVQARIDTDTALRRAAETRASTGGGAGGGGSTDGGTMVVAGGIPGTGAGGGGNADHMAKMRAAKKQTKAA